MPTYEYKCEECGIVFDRFQHFSEEPLKICPECNGPVHRVIHPVGIVFKGKGFYVTDNRASGPSMTPKSGSKNDEAKAKGESAASEAKDKPESSSTIKTPAKAVDASTNKDD